MHSLDLLSICAAAFIGVFLLLSILAVIMRIIILVFPEKATGTGEAVLAVISTTYKKYYPGTIVTRVEEEL